MSKTEIWKCDKCDEEHVLKGMIRVEMSKRTHFTTDLRTTQDSYNYDLCKSCAEKIGFKFVEKGEKEAPTQTKAEELYDLVAEMVDEQFAERGL